MQFSELRWTMIRLQSIQNHLSLRINCLFVFHLIFLTSKLWFQLIDLYLTRTCHFEMVVFFLGLNLASNVFVLGEGICMCFVKKPKCCHFLLFINRDCRQLSAHSLLSASLNFIIKSLFSGEGENASSSKMHFTFRHFALLCVIVLLEWVCFLPTKNGSSESQSLKCVDWVMSPNPNCWCFVGHVFKRGRWALVFCNLEWALR